MFDMAKRPLFHLNDTSPSMDLRFVRSTNAPFGENPRWEMVPIRRQPHMLIAAAFHTPHQRQARFLRICLCRYAASC